MAEFLCWSVEQSEDEAKPAWVKTYDWQAPPYLRDTDFERAAELFAGRKWSDWGYPDEFELFVKNEETGEIRFVVVGSEPGAPDFSANFDEEQSDGRLLVYRLTALARAALDYRPRPWNWKEVRWERLHPEEAAAKKATRAKADFDRRDGRCPWPAGEAPATWDAVQWPAWVPVEVRAAIAKWDRHPSEYESTFSHNNVQPRLGERVTFSPLARHAEFVTGRYVGSFNGMGYAVADDGIVHHGHALTCTAEKIAEMAAANRLARTRDAVEAAVKAAPQELLERVLVVLGQADVAEASEGNPFSQAPREPPLAALSERERAIVDKLRAGRRPMQIAKELFISHHTVRNYLKKINVKLGVHSQVELLSVVGGSRG